MLIVDDIIAAPFKGLLWIAKKISENAQAELQSRRQRITSELSELYMLLDTGKITEDDFDSREHVLLEQLDRVNEVVEGGGGEEHKGGEGEEREGGEEEREGGGPTDAGTQGSTEAGTQESGDEERSEEERGGGAEAT